METLRELYAAHRGKVADKWDLYLDVYERVLSPWRDKPIDFVEVGVQNGGSLEVWSKYFRNARTLTGCDVDPRCRALAFDDPRIAVVVAPINTNEAARGILARAPRFDVFIDDGSHISRDIVMTFLNYFGLVKPGGIFLIEDLHCAYLKPWGGGIAEPSGAAGFLKLLVDGIHHGYWRNDAAFSEMVAPYLPEGARADETIVADVASIAFHDSLCVIEKRAEDRTARLERRVIAGEVAPVDPKPLALRELVR